MYVCVRTCQCACVRVGVHVCVCVCVWVIVRGCIHKYICVMDVRMWKTSAYVCVVGACECAVYILLLSSSPTTGNLLSSPDQVCPMS